MIIYNVTNKVAHGIHSQWLKWLQEEHIPEILATGCFGSATVLHLVEADDEDGITYAIQYQAPDMQHYEQYLATFAEQLRAKSFEKWGSQFIAFRTLMRVVN